MTSWWSPECNVLKPEKLVQVLIRVLGLGHGVRRDKQNRSIIRTERVFGRLCWVLVRVLDSTGYLVEYSFTHLSIVCIHDLILIGFGSNTCNPNSLTLFINIAERELGLDFRTNILLNNWAYLCNFYPDL